MGDMADFTLDQMDDFDLSTATDPFHVTCRYCKTRHLAWAVTDTGYRLFNEQGEMHSCDAYRVARVQHEKDKAKARPSQMKLDLPPTRRRRRREKSHWTENTRPFFGDWDDFDMIAGNFGDWGDQ